MRPNSFPSAVLHIWCAFVYHAKAAHVACLPADKAAATNDGSLVAGLSSNRLYSEVSKKLEMELDWIFKVLTGFWLKFCASTAFESPATASGKQESNL